MPPTAIGIDVGGTKVLGIAVDAADPTLVLDHVREPTPIGLDPLLDTLGAVVGRLDPAGEAVVGLGIPGLVRTDGHFVFGPNLPSVEDVPLAAVVRERLGRFVAVDNDATCAALAEFRAGSGQGYDNGLLLTLGTGIGAGLIVDGEIRRGAHGFAAEPGHMLIDPHGPICTCGRRGCWERFASGSGLGRLGRDAAMAGSLDASTVLAGGDPEAVRGEHVVTAARAGDTQAIDVLDEFAWWVAAGIANLVDVLDPSVVVLGGGVMEAADVLLDRVRAAVPEQVMAADLRWPVDIVAAALGERAGAVGAALGALERMRLGPEGQE